MKSAKLNNKDAITFITGGHAIFTIKNIKTGNRFTYEVTAPKDTDADTTNILFVRALTSPDNNSGYRYIGELRRSSLTRWVFIHGKKSLISDDAPIVVAIAYVINKVFYFDRDPQNLEIWHEGKCCRCGRRLTVPESILSGIGPECSRIKQSKSNKERRSKAFDNYPKDELDFHLHTC